MKLNLGAGTHPLDDFINLDPTYSYDWSTITYARGEYTAPICWGWKFQDGLSMFEDASIEGISCSHALMMLPLDRWAESFTEFARVLDPGGVIRITEDATDDRRSPRYGGFKDAVTLTTRALVHSYLDIAGLEVMDCAPGHSYFKDDSLIQRNHGSIPKVFFCEGIKP